MVVDPLILKNQLIDLCEPIIEEKGFELVLLEIQTGKNRFVLRFYLDTLDQVGGITIKDCVRMSRELEDVLDYEEFMDFPYVLEVSSPGIDRPLRKVGDFERFAGEAVRLVTHDPVAGRRKFSGTLKGFGDGLIRVACDGEDFEIHIENLKKANLDR